MSRGSRLALAASLGVAAVIAGVWAWFLSRRGLADASEWSGVLQGFAALLAIPALVITGLGLRAPGKSEALGAEGDDQSVTIGDVSAGGSVEINVQQNRS